MVNNFVYNITHDKKQGPSLLDYQILSIKKKKKKKMHGCIIVCNVQGKIIPIIGQRIEFIIRCISVK